MHRRNMREVRRYASGELPEVAVSDLVAFLRARLAEDEWLAKAALEAVREPYQADFWDDAHPADDAHYRAHDPARVLREVEAKRAILTEYEKALSVRPAAYIGTLGQRESREEVAFRYALELACRHHAAVWRDHPEYDPAWQLGPPAPPHDGRPGGQQQQCDHGDENTQHGRPV